MNKIKIKLERGNAMLPVRSSEKAACYDVYASEVYKPGDNSTTVNLGFSATPPPGYKIVLIPRSSITKTNWFLSNSPGQGDEDYTGEYMMKFTAIPTYTEQRYNRGEVYLTYDPFPYKIGDRVGQMCLEKVIEFEFEQVEVLEESKRGDGGFGSTGT